MSGQQRTPGAPGEQPPGGEGLAAERTALAWVRMGMSMLALPGALLAYSLGRSVVALGAAAVAWALGLALLLVSLRQRDPNDAPALRVGHLATAQVTLTAAAALLITIAGLALVLRPA